MKTVIVATAILACLVAPVAAASAQQKKPVKNNRSVAARTALCKLDCSPGVFKPNDVGVHGQYRSYNEYDPHLTSIQGRKDFAQCVKACVDPLPAVYIQRPFLEAGMNWFGKSADSCYDCHATGKRK